VTLADEDGRSRCRWPGDSDPVYIAYHDDEWGVPERDNRALFEKLILDGFQAGLSWITILRKRDGFRRAFDGFDPEVIARYGEKKQNELMNDSGIIRNRSKIVCTVTNARAYLDVMDNEGSFSDYLWQFTDGRMLDNRWRRESDVPPVSPESEAMSKTLKKRGFKFVGPTICYAFMQAVGMVNDHVSNCFRHDQVLKL
jgi:DNA-3-methyladenine glycosylase I